MKNKKLKIPTNFIYLVGISPAYESPTLVAAFKTEKTAQKFIDECKHLIKTGVEEVKFGEQVLNERDLDDLQILTEYNDNGKGLPYFDK